MGKLILSSYLLACANLNRGKGKKWALQVKRRMGARWQAERKLSSFKQENSKKEDKKNIETSWMKKKREQVSSEKKK